jgi:hypothetical protein
VQHYINLGVFGPSKSCGLAGCSACICTVLIHKLACVWEMLSIKPYLGRAEGASRTKQCPGEHRRCQTKNYQGKKWKDPSVGVTPGLG